MIKIGTKISSEMQQKQQFNYFNEIICSLKLTIASTPSVLEIRCVKLISIDTTYVISSLNSMFDHLLESSRQDDSNK